MKRALVGLVAAVISLLVLLFLLLDERTGSNTLVLDEASPTPAPDLDDERATEGTPATEDRPATDEASNGAPSVPIDARPARTTALGDGDSFDITWSDSGETDELRLLGINAPETVACFGDASRAVLGVLTDGRELLVDVTGRDEFGRGLARVWVDGVFVNARVVELGAALAMSDGGDDTALLVAAQQEASENEVGLWDPTFCGAAAGATIVIDAIESDAPGQDNLNPNGEWIDITNIGDGGTDLTGWSIRDESTRHRFGFPDGFSLDRGASVRVFSGCGDATANELYWCGGDPIWNNGGDTGFLVDPEGRFVDTLSYAG